MQQTSNASYQAVTQTGRARVMCVKMTHTSATYTAVDDYDNTHKELHEQLRGAALIVPDSLPFVLCPTSLSVFPPSQCFPFFPSLG